MTKINFWHAGDGWYAIVYPPNPNRIPKNYGPHGELESLLITIARDIEGWPL